MQHSSTNERAAMVLATASVIGDAAAAEYHLCSRASIGRWRRAAKKDDDLAVAVYEARRKIEAEWVHEIPAGIRAALSFIKRASEEGDARDPMMVQAMTNAFTRLADAMQFSKMIDARLAVLQSRQVGPGNLQVLAGGRQDESDSEAG